MPILLAIYIQSIYPKRLLKNLYATPPPLFVPSAPPQYCVYLRPLRVSVCPLYKTFSSSYIFRKNFLLPCYHVFHYPVTMSFITLYHVLNTLLPCLLLPCTMSPITLYHVFHYSVTMSLITLSHVFHYPVTMSLITLSHVFHYPVTMSLITLSPSRNAKPQKKS